jgi:hypothetical protein
MDIDGRSGRVSVLMPTFNRGEMLSEALDSVLGQSIPPHQVVVIDDGSTDDTSERVARYGARIDYIRKANGGKSSALNLGLTHVTGDYVWVFDDDDVALPRSIADRLEVLEGNPGCGLVLARHHWGVSSSYGTIEARSESLWPPVDASNVLLTLMRGCFTTLQGALVRTGCYREVGPFREDLLRSQDYDMLLRLVRRFPVAFLDKPTYIARRHGGARGPAALRHAAEEREQVWARYDGLLGQHLRREAALGDFLSPPAGEVLTQEQTRQALLNRMSVMASKGLAAEMIEDAAAFVRSGTDAATSRLAPAERAVATASVQHRYFLLTIVPKPAEFESLARDLAAFPLGRDLLRAFSRGLLGLAKWGTSAMRERARIIRLAVGLAMLSCGARSAR